MNFANMQRLYVFQRIFSNSALHRIPIIGMKAPHSPRQSAFLRGQFRELLYY